MVGESGIVSELQVNKRGRHVQGRHAGDRTTPLYWSLVLMSGRATQTGSERTS